MVQQTPYHCNLLDGDGMVPVSVQLTAKTDTDAILMGNTLEREHPDCTGFEICAGARLVYMQKAEPIAGARPNPAAGRRAR